VEARILNLRRKQSSLLRQIKDENQTNHGALKACSELDQKIHAVKMQLAPLLGIED
jgi:hypothetical protein